MKSEKEKMLSGELYDSLDPELVKERNLTKNSIFEFNHTKPSDEKRRHEILENLLSNKGSFHIESTFNCDYGYNIELRENFYSNYECTILDVAKVKIWDNVLFAPNVQIYAGTHSTDPLKRLKRIEYAKPITIGAGSVVTKDIPDNVIAVGNPCKIIKHL